MLLGIWIITFIWAVVVTVLFFYRNPLPFPDRGHRVFGVPDEEARRVVVDLLQRVSALKPRWTFDSGEVHQTLMWDGLTSIHYLDPAVQQSRNILGTGLSVPTNDPARSASEAVSFLKQSGYEARVIEGINLDLPPNHLIPVESNAFNGWNLVFRRPLYKMPFPKIRTKLN
jgi:hypothetical protein